MITVGRSIALAALLAASGTLCACVVEATPDPVYAEGYQPMYYDGYVVYYDDAGRPYYYANGAVAWVPPGVPAYVGLVNHWRAYGPAYRRWNARYGSRYHAYRARARR